MDIKSIWMSEKDNTEMSSNEVTTDLNPSNIYLFQKYDWVTPPPPTPHPPDCVTNDEDNIHMQYVKQNDADDMNLSSFLSNINFIDHLCNLCDVLLNTLDSE